jgi:hypothetical protein
MPQTQRSSTGVFAPVDTYYKKTTPIDPIGALLDDVFVPFVMNQNDN